jgi:hypothetical protein
MKNTSLEGHLVVGPQTNGTRSLRYQIYRQARAGNYRAEFTTDSAAEAVESFVSTSPAFDGGAIRIWDHREHRVRASVLWVTEKTDFGFHVQSRTNLFHDGPLAVIARQIQEREALRESVRRDARVSLTV